MYIYISFDWEDEKESLKNIIDLAKMGKPLTVPVSFVALKDIKPKKDYLPMIMNLARQSGTVQLMDTAVSDVVLVDFGCFIVELRDALGSAKLSSEGFGVIVRLSSKENFATIEIQHSIENVKRGFV